MKVSAISSGLALCFLHVHPFEQQNELLKQRENMASSLKYLQAKKEKQMIAESLSEPYRYFLIMSKQEKIHALFSEVLA